MTEAIPLIALALPAVAIVVAGWRRREPARVVVGGLAGYVAFAVALWLAAGIGIAALWAVLLAALGVGIWAETEALWWRRRRDR